MKTMNEEYGIERNDIDIEAIYRKYGPMVMRRCAQMLRNADEAADAAQEVFVKLINSKNSLTAEYPSSLLFRMATNHCLNLLRDKVRRGSNENSDALLEQIAYSGGENDVEVRVENRGILKKLFGHHPESSKTIAVLHLFDGMTLEETAKEVGMSVSGVRKRLRALRETLSGMEALL